MGKQRAAARRQQAYRGAGRPIPAPRNPDDLAIALARAHVREMSLSTLGRYLDGAKRRRTDREETRG